MEELNSLNDVIKKIQTEKNQNFSGVSSVTAQPPAIKNEEEATSLDEVINRVQPTLSKELEVPGFTGTKASPMLIKVAQEYYGKNDPQEALESFVSDQTWNNANAAMALTDALKAQTADLPKARQMAFLGEEFEKLPAFWEGDRPLTEKAGRLWANVWRGAVDPVTWAGGAVGGKIASKVITSAVKPAIAKAVGAGAFDFAGGVAADVSQQSLEKSVGRREEYSVGQVLTTGAAMGLFGGTIRATGSLIHKGGEKVGLFKPKEVPIVQDNAAPKTLDGRETNEFEGGNKPVMVEGEVTLPDVANQNKFPEMERTSDLVTTKRDTIFTTKKDDEMGMGEVNFGGLKDLENEIKLLNNGEDDIVEGPKYWDNTQKMWDNPTVTITQTKVPTTKFMQNNHRFQQAFNENVKADETVTKLGDGTKDLAAPPPPPPKLPPIPKKEIPRPVRSPFYVEEVQKLTGKADDITYANTFPEYWAEFNRLFEENAGFRDVRPHITKEDALKEAQERFGPISDNVFKRLAKKLGVSDDRLSYFVIAALKYYDKKGKEYAAVASDLMDKSWRLGNEHPDTRKALATYAAYKDIMTANTRLFTESRSEIGRALSMLRPDQSYEEQMNLLLKELDKPDGLNGATLLCG